jgi:membrane protein YdbS with pleckstrin-like domain
MAAESSVSQQAVGQLPKGVTLHEGETPERVMYPSVGVTWPLHLWTLGLWEIWRRRHYLALTNQRLIHGKGVAVVKTRRSVPLSRVQDATYTRVLWMGGVEISSAGGEFGTLKDAMYSPRGAQAFVDALNKVAGHAGSPGLGVPAVAAPQTAPAAAPAGPAEDLRQLAKLREEGLVTEEEYEAKRQELLKRL